MQQRVVVMVAENVMNLAISSLFQKLLQPENGRVSRRFL